MANLHQLLKAMVEKGASDLHITTGSPPQLRIDGKLVPLKTTPLSPVETKQLCYSILTDAQKHRFEENLELDLSFGIKSLARFRANVFVQRGAVAAAFRRIPYEILGFRELGLPPSVEALCNKPRGLVLVTGPTGSGKSTTIASLLEQLNQHGPRRHVVTVEDPIEFVFEPRNAVFEQREVGTDTRSYARGLRGALRQMPNVIFVGEMRDLASMAIALAAAETGNLVISTMATQNAAQTVTRIVDSFPPHQQSQIRSQLALTLRAVISQVLLPRADGRGRVAAREVLFVTPAVANLIREDKIHQVPNVIATGGREDMLSLDDSLADLVDRGAVAFESAYPYFEDTDKRAALQKRYYGLGTVPEAALRRT